MIEREKALKYFLKIHEESLRQLYILDIYDYHYIKTNLLFRVKDVYEDSYIVIQSFSANAGDLRNKFYDYNVTQLISENEKLNEYFESKPIQKGK